MSSFIAVTGCPCASSSATFSGGATCRLVRRSVVDKVAVALRAVTVKVVSSKVPVGVPSMTFCWESRRPAGRSGLTANCVSGATPKKAKEMGSMAWPGRKRVTVVEADSGASG